MFFRAGSIVSVLVFPRHGVDLTIACRVECVQLSPPKNNEGKKYIKNRASRTLQFTSRNRDNVTPMVPSYSGWQVQ